MLSGNQAIEFLDEEVASCDDPAESSHWQTYHQDFLSQDAGSQLSGLQEFGGFAPRTLRHRAAHALMLTPYRLLPDARRNRALRSDLKEIARRQDRALDLDMLRQLCTLSHVEQQLPDLVDRPSTWLVIGDGFGVLSALILMRYPTARVALVNLDTTLLVDLAFIRRVFGAKFDGMTRLVGSAEDATKAFALESEDAEVPRLVAVRARDQEILPVVPADVVVNVVSMQEMRHRDIAGYFRAIRSIASTREVHFYCCNREQKTLPDGSVITFDEYPWTAEDLTLVDELTPWHQRFYTLKPPMYRRYDGPIRHRLIRVAPAVS